MSDFIIPAQPGWEVADGIALEVGEVIGWALKTDKLGDVTGLPIYVTKSGRVQTPKREYDGQGPTPNRGFILKKIEDE